ncbi:MAG: IS21 family transposase [Leptospiraceae bacterium]|nr:IS21 family transposase [Leptospiraceae bacterium]
MSEYREIIHRLRIKQNIREIQRETGTHRTLIREIRNIAIEMGWLTAGEALPDEHIIQEALGRNRQSRQRIHPLDAFRSEIEGWLQDGLTIRLMHQLIQDRHSCDESTVRRYVRRYFPNLPRAVIRRDTQPGEVMEVDFGDLGRMYDPIEKRNRKVYIFSARLRHSRLAYRERVYDQKQETFFQCHIHAFEFFGGVPHKIVMDNLKAAVIKASYQDPLINKAYRSLAEHYGFLISPNLPRRPEHKGGVENDIKYVKGNCLPLFIQQQKRLGRTIPDGALFADFLEQWAERVSHREIRCIGQPSHLFNSEEKSMLLPLPGDRWEPVQWGERKVQLDWHVQIGTAYYSVPCRYVGQTVQVCIGPRLIRIFSGNREIARHLAVTGKYKRSSRPEHAPPERSAYLQITSQGLLREAEYAGESVAAVAEIILSDKAVDGMRPVRALLSLSKKYGKERLQSACQRALDFDTPAYRSVKLILQGKLDLPADSVHQAVETPDFSFSRPGSYYSLNYLN